MTIEYLKITSKNKDILLNNPKLLYQISQLYLSVSSNVFLVNLRRDLNSSRRIIYIAKNGDKLLAGLDGYKRTDFKHIGGEEFFVDFIFTSPSVEKQNFGLKIFLRALADLRVNEKKVNAVKCIAMNKITNSIFKRAVGSTKIKINSLTDYKIKEILRKVGPENKIVNYQGVNLDSIGPEIHISKPKNTPIKTKIIKNIINKMQSIKSRLK